MYNRKCTLRFFEAGEEIESASTDHYSPVSEEAFDDECVTMDLYFNFNLYCCWDDYCDDS
jgi:hypothetical protein